MRPESKIGTTLLLLTVAFVGLTAAFLANPSALPPRQAIALVDTNFLDPATVRRSYADLIAAKEDLSDFDCYACHEKTKPPPLRYDTNQNLIIPKEHSNIVMHHGSHERNNNCFNCHDELNLELFQTKDKRELKLADSTPLCGSCHGPTYRDWEAGVHGRTSGHWDRSLGAFDRKRCVNCHNPHSPKFPGRKPAPGPHPLRISEHADIPLTPTLSPSEGEREHRRQSVGEAVVPGHFLRRALLFPLPRRGGEGQGEGISPSNKHGCYA